QYIQYYSTVYLFLIVFNYYTYSLSHLPHINFILIVIFPLYLIALLLSCPHSSFSSIFLYLSAEMGHERSNSQTEDHSDYVHRCPTHILVSIVSEPAWNEPAVSQDQDRSIPQPG